MGSFIYGLREEVIQATLLGDPIGVGQLVTIYKQSGILEVEHCLAQAFAPLMDQIRKAWTERRRPCLVVIPGEDGGLEGSTVFRWHPRWTFVKEVSLGVLRTGFVLTRRPIFDGEEETDWRLAMVEDFPLTLSTLDLIENLDQVPAW